MKRPLFILACIIVSISHKNFAQTESDGILMENRNFCGGIMYSYNSFTDYWEGTFKRDNENLGTVSNSSFAVMGNIGLPQRLNIIFSLPYIKTKASAGTLTGMSGLQDLSVFAKWKFLEKNINNDNQFGMFLVAGGSTPVSNYVADYLPLSIGLRSTTISGRLLADYQWKNWFITASGNYIYRNNITIDRNSYYTDKMIYSDEVFMPNVFSTKTGLGYRKGDLILEGVFDTWRTLGGFDIRKNDMPFPSNEMHMTRVGLNLKIPIKPVSGLSVVANSFYTLDGRNAGQSTSFTAGLFYVIIYKKDKSPTPAIPIK